MPSQQPEQNKEAFEALIELDNKERSFKRREGYMRAYIISVLFPPLGAYYLIKYLFFANGTPEDMKAGVISLVLTIASLVLTAWIFGAMFNQVSSLSPQGNSVLKDFITPANMNTFKNLMR